MTSPPAPPRPLPGRFTRAAILLLTLDGIALVAGGILARHVPLILAGVALCGGALFVRWYGRWHRRQLAEIAAARAALRAETHALRELIRER